MFRLKPELELTGSHPPPPNGVIDSSKVVRTALQNAASVAGLILTTDAMVAELPKEEKAPSMLPGGGMDY